MPGERPFPKKKALNPSKDLKALANESQWLNFLCRRPDSNRHGSPHHPLKMACLPSSTTSAVKGIIYKRHGFGNRSGGVVG